MEAPDRLGLFSKFLSYNWLRPEIALTTTLRAEKLAANFPSEPAVGADISCGDGAFSFLSLGGEVSDTTDMYGALDFSAVRSEGGDFHDHYDTGFSPEVLELPNRVFDVGSDWKKSLLKKAQHFGAHNSLVLADSSQALPLAEGAFNFIYTNSAYWVPNPRFHIEDLVRLLAPGGRLMLSMKTRAYLRLVAWFRQNSGLGERGVTALDMGRRGHWRGLLEKASLDELLQENSNIEVESCTPLWGDSLAKFWFIGTRPLFRPLAKVASSITDAARADMKAEFIQTLEEILAGFIEVYSPESGSEIEWTYLVKRVS